LVANAVIERKGACTALLTTRGYCRVVRGREDEAVGTVPLDHLQEAVQHAANLPHVIDNPALGADGVASISESFVLRVPASGHALLHGV